MLSIQQFLYDISYLCPVVLKGFIYFHYLIDVMTVHFCYGGNQLKLRSQTGLIFSNNNLVFLVKLNYLVRNVKVYRKEKSSSPNLVLCIFITCIIFKFLSHSDIFELYNRSVCSLSTHPAFLKNRSDSFL